MTVQVAFEYVLKSHESFTYVSPDVFSVSFKSRIINILQEIVRVSFSAPNASQKCGAFLFVSGLGGVCVRTSHKTQTINHLQTTLPQTWQKNRGSAEADYATA